MKISVSLPAADVEFLDAYAHTQGVTSRSGALHDAIQLLRGMSLREDYAAAWHEWADAGEDEAWDATVADGLPPLMRRGEIRFADLDPARGHEADKRRPVVVVSNDGANTAADRFGRGVVTVVPITSNVERVYAFQVLLSPEESGLPKASKAQAEQVRSIDVGRLGDPVGRLEGQVLHRLEDALRLHVAL